MATGRQVVWLLSCVCILFSCTACTVERINNEPTELEEGASRSRTEDSREIEFVRLQVEKPILISDHNSFEPNLLLTEVLEFADSQQDIELLSEVAAEIVLYGDRNQGLALFARSEGLKPDRSFYAKEKIGVDLARSGEVDRALSISRQFIDEGSGTNAVPILLEVAYQMSRRGQKNWAERLLTEAIEIANDNPDYVLGHSISIDELQDLFVDIATAYVRIGRADKALELIPSIRNSGDVYGYVTLENRSQAYSQILPLIDDIQQVYAVYELEKPQLRLNYGDGFFTLSDIAIRLFQLGDEVLPFSILEMLELENENNVTLLSKSGTARSRILSEISIHLARTKRYQESVEIAGRIKDEPDSAENSFMVSDFYHYKALALIQLADAFNQTNSQESTRQLFEEAFLLVREPRTSAIQSEVAIAFAEAGQIQTAMRYLRESKPVRRAYGDSHAACKALLSSLITLNQFDEAADLIGWSQTENVNEHTAVCMTEADDSQRMELLLTIIINMPDELKTNLDVSGWLSTNQ